MTTLTLQAAMKRAAEVLRQYASEIENSEMHGSGPMKGRCDPDAAAEIAEYRAVAEVLDHGDAQPTQDSAPILIRDELGKVSAILTLDGPP